VKLAISIALLFPLMLQTPTHQEEHWHCFSEIVIDAGCNELQVICVDETWQIVFKSAC